MPLTRRGRVLKAGGAVAAAAPTGIAVDEEWLPGKYRVRLVPAQLALVGRRLH